jgi:hypothetical protein
MSFFLNPESAYLIKKIRAWENNNPGKNLIKKPIFPNYTGKKEFVELVVDVKNLYGK